MTGLCFSSLCRNGSWTGQALATALKQKQLLQLGGCARLRCDISVMTRLSLPLPPSPLLLLLLLLLLSVSTEIQVMTDSFVLVQYIRRRLEEHMQILPGGHHALSGVTGLTSLLLCLTGCVLFVTARCIDKM